MINYKFRVSHKLLTILNRAFTQVRIQTTATFALANLEKFSSGKSGKRYEKSGKHCIKSGNREVLKRCISFLYVMLWNRILIASKIPRKSKGYLLLCWPMVENVFCHTNINNMFLCNIFYSDGRCFFINCYFVYFISIMENLFIGKYSFMSRISETIIFYLLKKSKDLLLIFCSL